MNENYTKFQAPVSSQWLTLAAGDSHEELDKTLAPNRASKITSLGQEPAFCIFKKTRE